MHNEALLISLDLISDAVEALFFLQILPEESLQRPHRRDLALAVGTEEQFAVLNVLKVFVRTFARAWHGELALQVAPFDFTDLDDHVNNYALRPKGTVSRSWPGQPFHFCR